MIVSGTAIYRVGDSLNELVRARSCASGVEHYIEPTGSGPVLNLDVFAPAREVYMHVIEAAKALTA